MYIDSKVDSTVITCRSCLGIRWKKHQLSSYHLFTKYILYHIHTYLREFRLLPQSSRKLRSSGLFITDVSALPIGPTHKYLLTNNGLWSLGFQFHAERILNETVWFKCVCIYSENKSQWAIVFVREMRKVQFISRIHLYV